MGRCCASHDARFTPASPKPSNANSPILPRTQPELLARHCTEAGLIEKAIGLWGKAGQRSLERSALVEALEQISRALDQIAVLPATPALRREQIKFQVALITPLYHVKGPAAPETKAAAEQARLLIEHARRSTNLPKTRCCCSRPSTAPGSQLSTHLMATRCASSRHNSWPLPRSKERQYHLWPGIGSWAIPCC